MSHVPVDVFNVTTDSSLNFGLYTMFTQECLYSPEFTKGVRIIFLQVGPAVQLFSSRCSHLCYGNRRHFSRRSS